MGFSEFKVEIRNTEFQSGSCCSATGPCPSQYTQYIITVRSGPDEWKIPHRYSDFVTLDAKLRDKFWYIDDLPVLPPKIVLFPKSEGSIAKRRLGLEEWLSTILKIGCFSQSSEMGDFLAVDEHRKAAKPIGSNDNKKQPLRKPVAEVSSPSGKPSPAQQHAPQRTGSAKTNAARESWMNGGAAAAAMAKVVAENQAQHQSSPANSPADAKANWMKGGAAVAAMAKVVAENQAKHQAPVPADSAAARSDWLNGGGASAMARVVAENQAKHAEAKKQHDVVLRQIFELADVDHSGFLDTAELLVLGQATTPTFTEEKCKRMMKQMDSNHDQKVDVVEFMKFAHSIVVDAVGIKRMRDAAEMLSKKAKASHYQSTPPAAVPAAGDYHFACQPDLKDKLRELFNTLDSSNEGYIGSEELTIFIRLTNSSLPAAWKAKTELESFKIRQSEFIETFAPLLTAKSLMRAKTLARSIFRLTKDDRAKLVQAFHDCDRGSGSVDANTLQELTSNTDVSKRDRTLSAIQHGAGEPITLDVFLAYFGWHLGVIRPEVQPRELSNISTQAAKKRDVAASP